MPTPLEDHVRAVLLERERGKNLFSAISAAWVEFCKRYPERSSWQRKSASRNLFWEVARKHLKRVTLDDDGISVVEHRDTFSLVVEDEILMRFKHASRSLMTQNVPTVEAREYDNHELDLFGRSDWQRVRLCYVLDKFETEIIWAGVAAHSRGKFLWKIELSNSGAEVAVPDLLDEVDDELDTTVLITPKRGKSDDVAKDDKLG